MLGWLESADTTNMAKTLSLCGYVPAKRFYIQGSIGYDWFERKTINKNNSDIGYFTMPDKSFTTIKFTTTKKQVYQKQLRKLKHLDFKYPKMFRRKNITCVNTNDHTVELYAKSRMFEDYAEYYTIELTKGARRSAFLTPTEMIRKETCRDTACINRYLLDKGFTLAKVDTGGNYIYPVYTYTSIPAGCSKLADSLDINTVRLAFNVRKHIEFISFKTYCEYTGKYWLSWFESSGFKFKFSNDFGADVYHANFSFPADLWYYYERSQKGIKSYRFTLLYEAWD